jgi:hypothetical protein
MKKGDIIIIVSLILISFVTSGFIIGDSVKAKSESYDFKFGNNTGFIEIKDNAVKMQEMDRAICPEGIYSDTGWISKNHQSIVWLPNRIIARFERIKMKKLIMQHIK